MLGNYLFIASGTNAYSRIIGEATFDVGFLRILDNISPISVNTLIVI